MKRTLAILFSLFVISAAACDGDNGPGSLCGNGVIDTVAGEGCDPGAADPFGGTTCATVGFPAGELGCSSSCLLVTADCIGPICGDGDVAPSERCDGTNLDTNDCTTINENFDGGTLACADDCFFDTASCIPEVCGDDNADALEVCDGSDLRGEDCVNQGLAAGTLACDVGCFDFDYSICGCPATDLGNWTGAAINESFDSCAGAATYGGRGLNCPELDWSAAGKEMVYSLTLADGEAVTASYTGSADTDALIFVITDCTDIYGASTCLTADDSTFLGEAETVNITNSTGGAFTYYIVADAYSGCGPGTLNITAQ